ncbi:MAG: imidazole glycerol phosphate synthase subunit HisH [Gammaproteobacteria bacterium]|nr:imidazole glycerol phosphate synthase subunit HisH [Gammaproteobacteria bacterium]
MSVVAIIDYGMGNLHSVAKAIERVGDGVRVRVTHDARELQSADRIVLPGVGAIRDCMQALHDRELVPVIHALAENKPLLGICLGMHALMDFSEENDGVECLGILPGSVRRFTDTMQERGERLKVPHMGWNQVHHNGHPLWRDVPQDSRFYFVHSYYVAPAHTSIISGTTRYGIEFCSVAARENVFATQFHPEKSQPAGLALLANFLRWNGV